MATLPLDTQGNPIPALGYMDGGAKTVTIASTTNRTSSTFGTSTRVISVYATVACFIRLGTSTVNAAATDHYIPAGVYHDIAIGPSTKDRYLAAIRADGTDGTLYISERE
jgi:hypothetical protein